MLFLVCITMLRLGKKITVATRIPEWQLWPWHRVPLFLLPLCHCWHPELASKSKSAGWLAGRRRFHFPLREELRPLYSDEDQFSTQGKLRGINTIIHRVGQADAARVSLTMLPPRWGASRQFGLMLPASFCQSFKSNKANCDVLDVPQSVFPLSKTCQMGALGLKKDKNWTILPINSHNLCPLLSDVIGRFGNHLLLLTPNALEEYLAYCSRRYHLSPEENHEPRKTKVSGPVAPLPPYSLLTRQPHL